MTGNIRLAAALSVGTAMLIQPASLIAQAVQQPLAPPANTLGTKYDVAYGEPFIDVDEERTFPRPHRYIHGGFKDSHLLFSVYLPPRELYKKRFLLIMEGGQGGMDKMMASRSGGYGDPFTWAFDLAFDDLGAYLVETNEGHYPDEGLGHESGKDVWQASAYATDYVRTIARAYYGDAPAHGYVNGCSGGGMRSSSSLENAPGLFDGGVSQAWGQDPVTGWSVYALVGTLLKDKLAQVRDAAAVGGGDLYAGLDARQAEALRLFVSLGYPIQAMPELSAGFVASPVIVHGVKDEDPAYFEDFWTRPGYVGHDQPDLVMPMLINEEATIEQVYTGNDMVKAGWARAATDAATFGSDASSVLGAIRAVRLGSTREPASLFMTRVTIITGTNAGKSTYVAMPRAGGVVDAFIQRSADVFHKVKVGDRVRIDNRDWLAYMYYHRYSVKEVTDRIGVRTPGHQLLWPQHKLLENPDGTPRYPQRGKRTTDVGLSKGEIDPRSKFITMNGMADEPIWPSSQELYGRLARQKLGKRADGQFRQWFLDRVPHCSGPLKGPRSTTYVPSTGINNEALRQVVRWAEQGKPAAPSTGYHFAPDNQLTLASTIDKRGGIQPIVDLKANDSQRVEVKIGEMVRFSGTAALPKGSTVVTAAFDFEGQGTWPQSAPTASAASTFAASATHAYDRPGTYFATFRVGLAALGRPATEKYPIYNLSRVRVVVR